MAKQKINNHESEYGYTEAKRSVILRYFIYAKSEDGLLKEHLSYLYGSSSKTFNNYGNGYLNTEDVKEAIEEWLNNDEYRSVSDLIIVQKPVAF
jgi:hypothetical protein